MDRNIVQAAIDRHCVRSASVNPETDIVFALSDVLEHLVNQRLPAVPVTAGHAIDEAALRRMAREAIAEQLPPAIERAMAERLQETPAERPRRRPHPLMPPGGWTDETYQIAAAVERERRFGPATPPPPPLPATHEDEMVDVVPTMRETLAIIWAWMRFRRTPKPSPEVIERELCRRKWKEASRAAARRR